MCDLLACPRRWLQRPRLPKIGGCPRGDCDDCDLATEAAQNKGAGLLPSCLAAPIGLQIVGASNDARCLFRLTSQSASGSVFRGVERRAMHHRISCRYRQKATFEIFALSLAHWPPPRAVSAMIEDGQIWDTLRADFTEPAASHSRSAI